MLRRVGIYRYKNVDCGMVLLCYNIGLYYKVYGPTVGLEIQRGWVMGSQKTIIVKEKHNATIHCNFRRGWVWEFRNRKGVGYATTVLQYWDIF